MSAGRGRDGIPRRITVGPDGNLWFTETNFNKIGRITPAGGITEFTIPTASSFPFGITAGPDGNLWFTEADGNKIGRDSGGPVGSGRCPEKMLCGAYVQVARERIA